MEAISSSRVSSLAVGGSKGSGLCRPFLTCAAPLRTEFFHRPTVHPIIHSNIKIIPGNHKAISGQSPVAQASSSPVPHHPSPRIKRGATTTRSASRAHARPDEQRFEAIAKGPPPSAASVPAAQQPISAPSPRPIRC